MKIRTILENCDHEPFKKKIADLARIVTLREKELDKAHAEIKELQKKLDAKS